MRVTQDQFRRALLDAASDAPAGLSDPAGGRAGRRFAVYRNNVAVGLTEALEAGFPILRKLLGEPFFRAMAGVFLRAHPPASPVLMFYGAEMPDFLSRFEPVRHLGYLPDVARLELALRESYHAADAAPLGAEALSVLQADPLRARVSLAPALRLLRSRWPLHGIWRAQVEAGAPPPEDAPEDVLVTRPGLDPVVALLPPGGAGFIAALAAGSTLGEAAMASGEGFEPAPTLTLLLTGGAVTGLHIGNGSC
jgi:hypothetical protein